MSNNKIDSGIDGRLDSLGSSKPDLTEAPPIHQKRLVTFFNHFVLNIVDFINAFSESCANKLFIFDQKISKIEAELRLLETKLGSIPELEDKKDVNVSLPPPQQLNDANDSKEEESEEKEPEEVKKEEPNPVIAKYLKMVQVGVPIQAVKNKMKQENVDPELLGM